jgi:hypothetical protein
MTAATLDWKSDLEGWLKPFLSLLGDKRRRRMCPVYVSGLIGPGDRKSISRWPSGLRPVVTINCTILSRLGSGMQPRWGLNCWFRQISSSGVATLCW